MWTLYIVLYENNEKKLLSTQFVYLHPLRFHVCIYSFIQVCVHLQP